MKVRFTGNEGFEKLVEGERDIHDFVIPYLESNKKIEPFNEEVEDYEEERKDIGILEETKTMDLKPG